MELSVQYAIKVLYEPRTQEATLNVLNNALKDERFLLNSLFIGVESIAQIFDQHEIIKTIKTLRATIRDISKYKKWIEKIPNLFETGNQKQDSDGFLFFSNIYSWLTGYISSLFNFKTIS